MDGYRASTYGDAFASVYDQWYGQISDVAATVRTIGWLRPGGRILELGVGTGRLAIPLVEAGHDVVGLDASRAMLDRLGSNDPSGRVVPVLAAMDDLDELLSRAGAPFDRPFDVVLVAYNTLFNLIDDGAQERCLAATARALGTDGRLVVEAFVPDAEAVHGSEVAVRRMTADEVVLSVSEHHPLTRMAQGHFIGFSEIGGVTMRPWAVRYHLPDELDAMASAAGLQLEHRWADFDRSAFSDGAERHVSVYRTSGS